MTVHVLIPVFNRLDKTRQVIACLRAQELDELLHIVIINDGSSDGTAAYLAEQKDVDVLEGDGSLWWGGAMEKGLQHIIRIANENDWVLMVNNDTQFAPDFIQTLLDSARSHAPAAVGSVICDETRPNCLLSIGGLIDSWRFRVRDKLANERELNDQNELHSVDVLSGRGTLYPLSAFHRAGTMRPRWLPHYLADYELAARVRLAGYRLLVNEQAVILSANEYGNAYQPFGWKDKFFNVRSAYYLPATLMFWWVCSSWPEKITLLPRLAYVTLKKRKTSTA